MALARYKWALGCGEGGLAWEDVREILEIEARAMVRAGIIVMLYPPRERPKACKGRT
jgi:hypothetical protein